MDHYIIEGRSIWMCGEGWSRNFSDSLIVTYFVHPLHRRLHWKKMSDENEVIKSIQNHEFKLYIVNSWSTFCLPSAHMCFFQPPPPRSLPLPYILRWNALQMNSLKVKYYNVRFWTELHQLHLYFYPILNHISSVKSGMNMKTSHPVLYDILKITDPTLCDLSTMFCIRHSP